MRLLRLTAFILLPALLIGCGGKTTMKPAVQAAIQAQRPALTDELVAEAWRENARRDSLRLAQMADQAKELHQSFNSQLRQVEQAAAQLVQESHPLTVFGDAVPAVKASGDSGKLAGKVEQVIGTLDFHGQELRNTGKEVGAALSQMQELAREYKGYAVYLACGPETFTVTVQSPERVRINQN